MSNGGVDPFALGLLDALGAATFPYQRYVMFGAFKTPGVAKIRPPTSPRTWNIQQGYGADGASVIYVGGGLAEFEVDIFLWEKLQFLDWELFATAVLGKPVPPFGIGSAMGVQHPLLNMKPWSIKSVVIKDVTGFDVSPTGLYVCSLKCLEYRQPKAAVARPIAAIPAAAEAAPTAQSAAEVEMLKVQGQIKLEEGKLSP
jgi:hypothetical protein